jgi:hypothetical protein
MKSEGDVRVVVSAPETFTQQKVVPFQDLSFIPGEGLVINGFPTVPKIWVKGESLVSATGQFISSTRLDPTELDINAHSRFLPNGFDDTAGVWRPFFTKGLDYYWRSPSGLSPRTEEIDYRIGKEVIRTPTLRFNIGDYLISSFNNGIDDAGSFAVALVVVPQTPLGYTLFSTQNSTHEISLDIESQISLHYGDQSGKVNYGISPAAMTPAYIIVSSNGNSATCYIGTSSRSVSSTRLVQRDLDIPKMKFTLGKTRLGKATGTFNLMELCLFDHQLNTRSKPSVYDVIGQLSAAYGAR